uniref:Uncharacterized protein n=1 Tax=Chromera velia CCMP2878 TaxID=1169474 RepID=A0A0G4HDW5_9ALVE|eukprot:Cvel_26525.t1-p1 / transcript=Cvel_26525.t1 / gene=Cvel_26525 / organism=Chromera_velia_CCMP2878 / gene_product=hypothetical protein / transcript_product=hypothetical protein / location=Cvel_scaffold3169:649-2105(-) / protein_length=328 / sequence_SO=supercontig / SO=protein_coding / is_pseudo=false
MERFCCAVLLLCGVTGAVGVKDGPNFFKESQKIVCDFDNRSEIYTNIHSVLDFKPLLSELDCIFALGSRTDKPPLGYFYSDVLHVVNTEFWNDLIQSLWKGKAGLLTRCAKPDGTEQQLPLVFNAMISGPGAWGIFRYSDLTSGHPVREGEYRDDLETLVIDYDPDLDDRCPDQYPKNKGSQAYGNANLSGRLFPGLPSWPVNAILDFLRFVGRNEKGHAILLGRALFKQTGKAEETDPVWVTLAWFWLVTDNPDLTFTPPAALRGIGYGNRPAGNTKDGPGPLKDFLTSPLTDPFFREDLEETAELRTKFILESLGHFSGKVDQRPA